MPILDLQTRARELGRIRLGQVVSGANGRSRPEKLDRFRITSASQVLIERIAELYGGEARPWTPQGGGAAGWEVVTTSTRLPVLVPPQPVSQWYELWSGGGCQRRCDGVTEMLSDRPCLCGPDPEERDCKPTTRLNVVLREVEGIGVFRLETHGYYAAVELPSAAELLAATRGYITGHLGLEQRTVKRNGQTRQFMVPTLEVDMTPQQLMAGGGFNPPPALEGSKPLGLPAGSDAGSPSLDVDSVRAAIAAVSSLEELRALWPEAKAAGLVDLAVRRSNELDQPAAEGVISAALEPTADDLWLRILQAVPETWTTEQVETEFAAHTEVPVEQASAADMQRYLTHLGTS
jgi:hypothetical protein